MVLVQVAFATSTVLSTAGDLTVRARLAVARPGDVVDLLVHLARAVDPALHDLVAVEIGPDRILECGDEESRCLAVRHLPRSTPIGTPLV